MCGSYEQGFAVQREREREREREGGGQRNGGHRSGVYVCLSLSFLFPPLCCNLVAEARANDR